MEYSPVAILCSHLTVNDVANGYELKTQVSVQIYSDRPKNFGFMAAFQEIYLCAAGLVNLKERRKLDQNRWLRAGNITVMPA